MRYENGKKFMIEDDELQNILRDKENFESSIESSFDGDKGILISTNVRLIFVSKGWLSGIKVNKDIYYNKIKEINYGKGIFSGWIEIQISKSQLLRFDNVDNAAIIDFAENLKRKIIKIDKTYYDNKSADYSGKSISAFYFKASRFEVNSWKELLVKIVDIIHDNHKTEFNKILDIPGRKRQYFTYHPEKLNIAENINGTDIYMETKLGSNSIVSLCYDIIRLFGYSDKDLIIETDNE